MNEAQRKWAEERGQELRAQLEQDDRTRKDNKSRKRKQPCLTEDQRKEINAEAEAIQHKCSSWDIGDEIRRRWIWKEDAEAWAKERIRQRKLIPEQKGYEEELFLIHSDDQDERLKDQLKEAKGHRKAQIEFAIDRNQNAKNWLPVCYEYVRQSERWLTWARMTYTANESEVPFAESDAHSHGRDILAKTLGQGWIDALGNLSEFLGQDVPFSEIPMEKRQSIARLASSASSSQVQINPDTFAIQDAGRPTFEPLMKWAGRQVLRLANIQEATCTGKISVLDVRGGKREHRVYEYRDAFNATVDESFIKPHKGKWIPGKSEIVRRTNDNLTGRRVSKDGEESIVLRVNWNTTSNQELGEAFADLCKRIRPTKWEEFKEQAGDHDQGASKALRLLLYWRMSAAIEAPIKRNLAEMTTKQEIANKRKKLGRAIRDRDEAEDWFKRITGDTARPWWIDTNRKSNGDK